MVAQGAIMTSCCILFFAQWLWVKEKESNLVAQISCCTLVIAFGCRDVERLG